MMSFIFKFGPTKGQYEGKLDQSKSNFQIQNYLSKYVYLVHFCLRIPKKVIHFHLQQLEIPKIVF